MATPIEEYLSSPAAIEEVRVLLAKRDGSIALTYMGEGAMWCVHDLGAWNRVVYRPTWGVTGEVMAYYRLESACFIVTDLGEAVHAIRLRTGMGATAADAFQWDLLNGTDGLDMSDGEIAAIEGDTPMIVAEALPAAIYRVLLAAYRVVNLAAQSAEYMYRRWA